MGSAVDQLSPPKNENLVGPPDLTEPVGNDEGRSLAADATHGLLDQILRCAVYGAGAVVENENSRIAEEGSGYGDPLFLPSREGDSPLADHGFVAVAETGNKIVGLGLPCCFDHIPVISIGTAKGDVLANTSRKEKDVLLDSGDLGSKRLEAPFLYIYVIDQHSALGGFEDPVYEAAQRGLA